MSAVRPRKQPPEPLIGELENRVHPVPTTFSTGVPGHTSQAPRPQGQGNGAISAGAKPMYSGFPRPRATRTAPPLYTADEVSLPMGHYEILVKLERYKTEFHSAGDYLHLF